MSRDEDDAILAGNLVGQVLLTTDCEEEEDEYETPALPVELADIIFDYALDDLRTSDDPASFRNLLHVSSPVRFKMLQAFKPIELWDCEVCISEYDPDLKVSRNLAAYVGSMPAYRLADVTLRRDGLKAPARLESATFVSSEADPQLINWEVKINTEPVLRADGRVLAKRTAHTHAHSTREVDPLTDPAMNVSEAYDALDRAFEGLDASALRFANPYQRLLASTLGVPAKSVIHISLLLPHENGHQGLSRLWKFEVMES